MHLNVLNPSVFKWVPFRGIVGKLTFLAALSIVPLPFIAWYGDRPLMREAFYALLTFALFMAIGMLLAWCKDPLTSTLEGPDLVKHHQQKLKAEAQIKPQKMGAFIINESINEITLIPGTYTFGESVTFGISESTKIEDVEYLA